MLLPKEHHITLKVVACFIHEYKKKNGGHVPSYVIVSNCTHYHLKREFYACNGYTHFEELKFANVTIISSNELEDNQIEVVKSEEFSLV
jgi:hypothetical protein